MGKFVNYIWLVLLLVGCSSPNEISYSWSAVDNIDALYRIIDEKYCFLDEKGCDWDLIHEQYRSQAQAISTDNWQGKIALFDLMTSMLDSLQDGHVNIYTGFDIGRNKDLETGYPANYDSDLQNRYLGDYRIAGGLYYNTITRENDSIGYICYKSFSSSCSDGALSWIFLQFLSCKGIILDVRNNGGGDLTNAYQLASPFFRQDRIVGYWQHKTGKGHSDFSQPEELVVEKNNLLQWKRPVVILTNHKCYSATNFFVNCMRQADNCLIVGGKTGGGGGMPLSYELPCGWTIRFSSVRMFDTEMHSIEPGIDPDVEVTLSSKDRDDLIEYGIQRIIDAYKK